MPSREPPTRSLPACVLEFHSNAKNDTLKTRTAGWKREERGEKAKRTGNARREGHANAITHLFANGRVGRSAAEAHTGRPGLMALVAILLACERWKSRGN